jgi:hypothetical protein
MLAHAKRRTVLRSPVEAQLTWDPTDRQVLGDEMLWQQRLGRHLASIGADRLWDFLATPADRFRPAGQPPSLSRVAARSVVLCMYGGGGADAGGCRSKWRDASAGTGVESCRKRIAR